MHFTENKGNANASAIKTPFLIEDILDRSAGKPENKMHFKNHNEKHDSINARNNNVDENINRNEKNLRINSELPSSDADEYRKMLQSERYSI